jgi:hypothetical protein
VEQVPQPTINIFLKDLLADIISEIGFSLLTIINEHLIYVCRQAGSPKGGINQSPLNAFWLCELIPALILLQVLKSRLLFSKNKTILSNIKLFGKIGAGSNSGRQLSLSLRFAKLCPHLTSLTPRATA